MAKVCCFKKCRNCLNGILIKTNYWGDRIYSCSEHPNKEHKEIYAINCGHFKCMDYEKEFKKCSSCRGKN